MKKLKKVLLSLAFLLIPVFSYAWDFIEILEDDNTTDYIYPEIIKVDDETIAFLFKTTFDTQDYRTKMKGVLNLSREPKEFFTAICYNPTWNKMAFMKFTIKDADGEIIDDIDKDKLEWGEIEGKKHSLYRDRARLLYELKLQE